MNTDFFFIKKDDPEQVADEIVKLVRDRLPKAYKQPLCNIQVLTPMQRSVVGAGNLNTVLQQALNHNTLSLSRGGNTYKLGDMLTVMPGVRYDHSSIYGSFFTPRLHLKFSPSKVLTLRASAGKGYRTPHALAENTTLLASGRTVFIDPQLKQEEAWNMGLSAMLNLPVFGKQLEINAEYDYTDFANQMIVNFDGEKGNHTLSFENLQGKSYSHTLQIDATYPFFSGFTATGAFRFNDVKCTYDGVLRRKPLTSRYKGLLTLSYKTPMEIWQFDVTGQLNGSGMLYDRTSYPAYLQLQAQVTREFPRFSLYLGGENLTNYKISSPIQHAHHPWTAAFDATQIWGPVNGAMAYIGIRIKFEKL